jgi:PhoPQ-activated pathogenicity-related protein
MNKHVKSTLGFLGFSIFILSLCIISPSIFQGKIKSFEDLTIVYQQQVGTFIAGMQKINIRKAGSTEDFEFAKQVTKQNIKAPFASVEEITIERLPRSRVIINNSQKNAYIAIIYPNDETFYYKVGPGETAKIMAPENAKDGIVQPQ